MPSETNGVHSGERFIPDIEANPTNIVNNCKARLEFCDTTPSIWFKAVCLSFWLCVIDIFEFIIPAPNGLRYLRWGGDGEAVQPEK